MLLTCNAEKSILPDEVMSDYACPCNTENVLDPTSSDHHKVEELHRHEPFFCHMEMITNQEQSTV